MNTPIAEVGSVKQKRLPAPKIVERMRAYESNVWRWHEATCRFCGSWERRALKYGTRHYACADCVHNILMRADAAKTTA